MLVATNLFGRGMDIERVNIVFNYDMPEDSDTYLHRVNKSNRNYFPKTLDWNNTFAVKSLIILMSMSLVTNSVLFSTSFNNIALNLSNI